MTGSDRIETDVVIIGAGPVGLTLAADLSGRGIRTVLIERRPFDALPSVKCNHVSARSMEQFRRLGIAGKLRDAGLPPDFPNDVAFRTRTTGPELSRVHIPGRATRFSDRSGPDGWWPTPEPPHRMNQIYLEPILRRHVAELPGVRMLAHHEAVGFVQEADQVRVTIRDLGRAAAEPAGIDASPDQAIEVADPGPGPANGVAMPDGRSSTVIGRYLIGCEGGRSLVRKGIGAHFEGTAEIQKVQSTYIRAPGLRERIAHPAWCSYSYNRQRCGAVFAIDGIETWLIHNHLNASEPGFDAVDRDWAIRQILGVDDSFEYEVLAKEDWIARRLLATRFRGGEGLDRAFLCGDSAHLWVPYAGYGMNAGIADAVNLAWHLSARLRGWGGPAVLDAYSRERWPITDQVSHFAMNHAREMIKARGAIPEAIEEDGPAGEEARRLLGHQAYDLNVRQFCCAGLNFGYFYDDSPLIAYDDEKAPPYTMDGFTPSTVPGCRAPHFHLADGRSLYDAFGPDYTLLRFDPALSVDGLLDAASAAKLPMTVLDITRAGLDIPDAWRHALVLCRADQHVAWRGDACPADPATLVERLCGRAPAAPSSKEIR